jgi:DNA invertase Pin-like site-specific DNA recombinase
VKPARHLSTANDEGWVCLPQAYDDGGFSGATMDRPALQQLLADLTAGRIDTVVVYKIDRLTRSLTDFAKIVEILDTRGASFGFGHAAVQHDDLDGGA